MKRTRIGLLIGLVVGIGFLARSFWTPESASPVAAVSEKSDRQVVQVAVAPEAEAETPPGMASRQAPKHAKDTPSDEINSGQSAPTPVEHETTQGWTISEESVAEMERQRGELREYAVSFQTEEGWRIRILPGDQVFGRAGLSTGDLITFESLERELEIPERAELAARLVSILNTIRQ